MKSFNRDLFFTIISFFLLLLSFPKYDLSILAWVGLVPFLLVLEKKKPVSALGWGYFLGLLFFGGTLHWITHVTLLGTILLVMYLSTYFALFALGCRFFAQCSSLWKLLVLPALWVALEFVRGHFLTGFGWASLGYSQYKNLVLIQIADLTGVGGVSFLIIMVNVVLVDFIGALTNQEQRKRMIPSLLILIVLIFIVSAYGVYHLQEGRRVSSLAQRTKVAVVQGNIAQEIKWNQQYRSLILEKYLRLTEKAAFQKPDLIIWPETSFPGYFWETPELFEELKAFVAKIQIPVLLGVVRREGYDYYYNSAFLMSEQGEIVETYDKLHLVPFGEYIPLRKLFPFLAQIAPIEDFTPGERYTLFPVSSLQMNGIRKQSLFGVLICFEDTIPKIARGFTQQGAQLLVNITNDAWFKDTKEPFMHLQGSVFRAVENRRSVIRSANTGVSCFIDPYGKVYRILKDETGKSTYVSGYELASVYSNLQKTVYTKLGDVFTYLCFGCILLAIILNKKLKMKS